MQCKAASIGKLHSDRNLEGVLDMEQGCKRMQTYNTLLTSYHQPPTEFRRLFATDVENILGLCGNLFQDLLAKFAGVSDFPKSFCNEFEQHLVRGMMDGLIWSVFAFVFPTYLNSTRLSLRWDVWWIVIDGGNSRQAAPMEFQAVATLPLGRRLPFFCLKLPSVSLLEQDKWHFLPSNSALL